MAEASTPSSEFRYFPKLPAELQLMVWDIYRDTQPLIKHYFSLDPWGGRTYGAVDTQQNRVVDRLVKRRDNEPRPLPYYRTIRLTGMVLVDARKTQVGRIFDEFPPPYRLARSAFAYVDLERDIFCFDCAVYSLHWFTFLCNPINQAILKPLPGNHWIFSARNIALGIPDNKSRISTWDLDILENMKQLKNVWIVAHPRLDIDSPNPTMAQLNSVTDTKLMRYAKGSKKSLDSEFRRRNIRARLSVAIDNGKCWT